jgi:hypothetical protein
MIRQTGADLTTLYLATVAQSSGFPIKNVSKSEERGVCVGNSSSVGWVVH